MADQTPNNGMPGFDADTASASMRAAGERMQAAGSAIAGQGSQLGLKVLTQAEANTQEAFRAMRAAAQASDLNDVMRIQSEYLREQGNRSMAQAREIGELIAEFGRNAVGQMTGGK
ncbi:phasin family protein [Sphingomonas sp. CFBP 13720]|uniref:phasin family protein n=1 Tax=Sphingomonas sp. CFBP 13720 TaxID=2775302 RepID=UPI0020173804|nr:phasin family protein [Sphingomonas sp. CFBP 13720]